MAIFFPALGLAWGRVLDFLNPFWNFLNGPFGDRRHTKLNMENRRSLSISATVEHIFPIFGGSNSLRYIVFWAVEGQSARKFKVNRENQRKNRVRKRLRFVLELFRFFVILGRILGSK